MNLATSDQEYETTVLYIYQRLELKSERVTNGLLTSFSFAFKATQLPRRYGVLNN